MADERPPLPEDRIGPYRVEGPLGPEGVLAALPADAAGPAGPEINHPTEEIVMPEKNVTVEEWVEMFRAIGLTEPDMEKWHAEFERRHPDGHQGFLEWLQMPAERIAGVRRKSAEEW